MSNLKLESGDKAWLPEFLGSPGETVEILGIGPEIVVAQGESRYYISPSRLTLLPPWIDEPSPISQIQKVFEEIYEGEL